MTALVCLSTFKLAHYVTGDVKWHNEYMMAALDPAYEYARITTQYKEQCHLYMLNLLNNELGGYTAGLITADILINSYNLDMSIDSPLTEMLMRLFLNYSDEEMAMLAFYILFQMETDETLLAYYREAIDDWWTSIKYSEPSVVLHLSTGIPQQGNQRRLRQQYFGNRSVVTEPSPY